MRTLAFALCASLLLVSGETKGGPADESETADTGTPVELRERMEDAMGQLNELTAEAKQDGDLVRVSCILDKQEQADAVMEVATGEMLVIDDPETTADARAFAVNKLDAASERLTGLVQQAQACEGEKAQAAAGADTKSDEPDTIPIADPTAVPPWGPPGHDVRPPVVGSPAQ